MLVNRSREKKIIWQRHRNNTRKKESDSRCPGFVDTSDLGCCTLYYRAPPLPPLLRVGNVL